MNTYRVEFSRVASKELAKLPVDLQRRAKRAIDALAADPRPPGVKKLKGSESQYRVRFAADYRVVYEIRDDVLVVLVVTIAHRREVYR